jgi:hypothetical protein
MAECLCEGNAEMTNRPQLCDYVQFKLSRVDTHGKVIWEPEVAGGRELNLRQMPLTVR